MIENDREGTYIAFMKFNRNIWAGGQSGAQCLGRLFLKLFEYSEEPIRKQVIYIDDDGYVSFTQETEKGSILWSLTEHGWKAFINDKNKMYATGDVVFPSKKQQREAYDFL